MVKRDAEKRVSSSCKDLKDNFETWYRDHITHAIEKKTVGDLALISQFVTNIGHNVKTNTIAVDVPSRKRDRDSDETPTAKVAKNLWVARQFTDATVHIWLQSCS